MSKKALERIKTELKKDAADVLKDLFTEHQPYCVGYLSGKLKVEQEGAKDIFIDALLNFRDKMLQGKVEYITSIKSYLLATCVNMAKADIRKQIRVEENKHQIQQTMHSESSKELSEKQRATLRTFEELSAACQRILKCFYVHHFSMEELAEELGFANANVAKVQKSRCLSKWKQLNASLPHGTI